MQAGISLAAMHPPYPDELGVAEGAGVEAPAEGAGVEGASGAASSSSPIGATFFPPHSHRGGVQVLAPTERTLARMPRTTISMRSTQMQLRPATEAAIIDVP